MCCEAARSRGRRDLGDLMAVKYNSPPNWPAPPPGWTPPKDWRPDPAWGPAPAGWQFWTDENEATSATPPGRALRLLECPLQSLGTGSRGTRCSPESLQAWLCSSSGSGSALVGATMR